MARLGRGRPHRPLLVARTATLTQVRQVAHGLTHDIPGSWVASSGTIAGCLATADDGLVATASAGSNGRWSLASSFSIPSNATVHFIRITARARNDGSGDSTLNALIRHDSTIYNAPVGNTVINGTNWVPLLFTWTTDPRTGAVWTPAGVDTLQAIGLDPGDFTPAIDVDYLDVTVHYTVPYVIKRSATMNTNNGSSATISVTTSESPGTTAVGDVVVFFHHNNFYTASTMGTPTATGSPTIIAITNGLADAGTNLAHIKGYWYVVNTAGAQTISVTESGSADEEKAMVAYVLRGVDTTTPIDIAANASGSSSASQVAPAVSPATAAFLISIVGSGGGGAVTGYTPPGGMDEDADYRDGGICGSAASQQLSTNGGTGTRTFTAAGATPWASVTVAVKAASDTDGGGGGGNITHDVDPAMLVLSGLPGTSQAGAVHITLPGSLVLGDTTVASRVGKVHNVAPAMAALFGTSLVLDVGTVISGGGPAALSLAGLPAVRVADSIHDVDPGNLLFAGLAASATANSASVDWSAGLLADWDPDELSGSDGTAVSSWTDVISGFVASQGTGANQPVLGTIGSHRSVVFDGTNDALTLAGGALDLARNKGSLAIFAVIKMPSSAVTGVRTILALSSGTNAAAARLALYARGSGGNPQMAGRRLDADAFGSIEATTPLATDYQGVLTGRVVWSSRILTVYQDGTSVANLTTFQTAGSTSDTSSLAATIGSNSNASSERFSGALLRLLVFPDADAAKRAQVHTYLATTYGLTVSDYISNGTVTGAVNWAGSAAGARASVGTASGAVAWAGSANGSMVPEGSASGAVTWSGAATGAITPEGASTGSVVFSGAATGLRAPEGTATGSIAWDGFATSSNAQTGSSSGTITWAGSGAGTHTPIGTASGDISWQSSGTGTTVRLGAAGGTITWEGAASSTSAHTGTAAGSVLFSGAGAGTRAPLGTGSGAVAWSGTSAGVRDPEGTSTGAVQFTGSGVGIREREGSAVGGVTWSATAIGNTGPVIPFVPAPIIIGTPRLVPGIKIGQLTIDIKLGRIR